MLSRHILEEILSVDENPRASERQKKAKKMRKREARFSKRSRLQIARELTKGKQAQVLCQTDGVNRREISQPTNTMGPYEVDGSRLSTTCRRAIQNHHLCFRTQRVRHPYFQLSTMEHARGASTSSPESRTPVRLYDSDGTQNPRVLRAVIDDMVLTGLAGGILKAKQSSDIDNLKRQYELARLWATELEDRLFQSQTGVPHRQLLGELRLEQEEGVTYDQERDFEKRGAKKVHELHRNSQLLIPSKPRCTKPPSSYPSWVSLSCKRKMVSSRYKSSLNLCTSMGETQASTTFKEVTPRHKNFPQPPLTPTSSLAQYISSLRPFSARGAKAAWGLAEVGERSDNPGSPLVEEPAKGYTEHTWPILFVMGNVKPSGIHPLALHTSLRFGDELLFRVAKASGESRESILAMASVLEQLDFTCLQRSVERLCHAQHTQDQLFLSRSNPEVRSRRGVRGSQMTNNAVLGAPEMGDERVILSETSALRALTSGFLANVFGDQTIRAILEVSRPMVVFDSTDSEPSYPAGEVADIVRQDVGSSPVSLERKPSSWELQRRGLADHCRGSAMGSLGGDHNLKNDGARVDHITSSSAQCASASLSPSRSVVRNTTTSDPLGSSKFRGARQGEGILVTQLVRATIARFRVHSVALRLVYGASTGSPRAHEISEEGDAHMAEAPAPGVADSGTSRRRQAPSHTDHLGSLPPLKLQKRERGMMPARRLLAMDGSQSSATKNSAGRLDKDLSADGSVRPRSTPRCLRPGFKVCVILHTSPEGYS